MKVGSLLTASTLGMAHVAATALEAAQRTTMESFQVVLVEEPQAPVLPEPEAAALPVLSRQQRRAAERRGRR